MTTEQPKNPNQTDAVQHDSETPLAKKPSVLFILSTSIGLITIITVVISVYRGVAGF
ncbi:MULTISPECIES: hypothetical protein [unclassified Coleofasciculus]|uniref:hypothetical protein n=1 Tax=Cyanophyceae TaxID=3028117 RepID=UPI0016899355|nr:MULTISPECIES: hypothetical protein [unclassified Coleofasciculus]MBD2084144.1 hypothetical protein [Coleofasciculus sp. FACHB-542]MBD2542147.1 hypothetical protein [Coleofasciculus sp. FACHB-SPT36]